MKNLLIISKNKTQKSCPLLLSFACIFIYFLSLISPYNYSLKNINSAQLYESSKIVYAKVLDNCMLYRTSTMSNDFSNVLFYIPTTYFVSIVSKVSDDVVKVQYREYSGFCYYKNISPVSFNPITTSLQGITFDINPTAGTQLWNIPSSTNGIKLTTIPANTHRIEYISCTTGEIPLGGTVNTWYYARYTPSNIATAVYEGYIYSEATVNLSNIPSNLEVENEPPSSNTSAETIPMSSAIKTILIILICLPFVILLIASIIKATKHIKDKKVEPEQSLQNKPISKTSSVPVLIKKRPLKIQNKEDVNDDFEIVFPEYDYIDDDDLL